MATFHKGIHPDDHKSLTNTKPIEVLPPPEEVFIPLHQSAGAACTPVVKAGDLVKTGQVIGRSEKYVSSPVHASITGKVKDIGPYLHPLGMRVHMIHVQRAGEESWETLPATRDWEHLAPEQLRQLVRDAGIVGLGGAAFPTHVKLAPPPQKPVDTFILNGCECEPYLTADHRLMVEQPEKVLTGMAILMHILGVRRGLIGIEDNKPDAVATLENWIKKLGYDFRVVVLATKYPQGAEKMLIHALLRRRVPAGGLPFDVGVMVNNVGTALAVAEAVCEGKPLIERVVTVTGDGIPAPGNVRARIGTPFKQLLDHCGGLPAEAAEVFMGGPLMGQAQYDLTVPVVKATSGIICTTQAAATGVQTYPCIRCGACLTACPMNLAPTRLARFTEMGMWENAAAWGIMSCMECGCCAFVCPAHIPLVQWLRLGKLQVAEKKSKAAA